MTSHEVVWLTEKRHFAWLLHMGAFYSSVMWTEDGIDFEEVIANDEYELWEDRANGYEHD